MFLAFRRIVKTGFVNFWRNGFVSVSSVIVMTITLFVIGSLIFLNAILTSGLEFMSDKVDINTYFVIGTPEEDIKALQSVLENLPEVKQVTYRSRDEAEQLFRERHKDNEIEIQALDELGENPLEASLSIRATDPIHYEEINLFLQTDSSTVTTDGNRIISKVNFKDNRTSIERLTNIMLGVEKFGLVISLTLIISSIIIIFNTIRMAIYISREEISVMRLVGASDAYIRGPFVFEGIMYGLIAAIITLVSFYPLAIWLAPAMSFFGDINLFVYYTQNFGQIFLTIMAAGILLGGLSSFLAVKKYLRT